MLNNGVNQYHTVISYADGITITFGDSVSRRYIRLNAARIAEDERKRRRKEKRK
ncbi:hypothetical protein [Paenibacillus sp. 23TSA30-6]|uniref:hypothetical protein n=1 Tax=Paenibacillus sp. 23TSA30-6 TaxID=2546104 RepID=UPI001787EA49|nr:hypothetical protein [Paenibacillus sp. 23TSA30-6]